MGFGSALLSGDECYSKELFDEAIDWYAKSANEGNVEAMEKLLNTCVERAEYEMWINNDVAFPYWKKASTTLRGIMQHGEISKEIKDKAYKHYEDIMFGLGCCYFLDNKSKEAKAAFEKIEVKKPEILELAKAYSDFLILAGEEEEKINQSLIQGKEPNCILKQDVRFVEVFKRLSAFDSMTEEDCKRIKETEWGPIELMYLYMLNMLIPLYHSGCIGLMVLVDANMEKLIHYWKLLKVLDYDNVFEKCLPAEVAEFCRKLEPVVDVVNMAKEERAKEE